MPDGAKPRLFGDAGSPRASDPDVWWHHCTAERDMIATGKGEPCSWCGRTEPKPSGGEIQNKGTPVWA